MNLCRFVISNREYKSSLCCNSVILPLSTEDNKLERLMYILSSVVNAIVKWGELFIQRIGSIADFVLKHLFKKLLKKNEVHALNILKEISQRQLFYLPI